MTVARQLAEFLTATTTADLPPQALDHAAMLIASTIASAAYGTGIEFRPHHPHPRPRARRHEPDASLWFDTGAKLPVAEAAQANAVMSDAAASDDSDLRNIVHAGTPLTATSLALAERNGADGEAVLTAMVLGYEAAGRISEAITPGFRKRGFHGCLGAIFAATVVGRAAAAAGRGTNGAGDRAVGDLDRRAGHRRRYQHGARVSRRAGDDARDQRRARGATRLPRRNAHPGNAATASSRRSAASMAPPPARSRRATSGQAGTSSPTWRSSWCPAATRITPSPRPPPTPRATGNIAAAEVASITISRPGMTALPGPLHPADLIDMAHSPAYFVAAGVADGEFSWAHASAAKIADPVIHGLIDRVRVGAPPTDDAARYRQGATVTIRTHDGQGFERARCMCRKVPARSASPGAMWTPSTAHWCRRRVCPLRRSRQASR